MWNDADYSEVATEVALSQWRELLERAQNGERQSAAAALGDDQSPAACLVRGALLYESDPKTGKQLFGQAMQSEDGAIADQAAIYEAKACEFLGQLDEGRKLIQGVLKRKLEPRLRAHALIVYAGLHVHSPKRSLRALDRVDVQHLSFGMAGRFYTVRARALRYLGQLDAALIEYAGAASFYEQAGHVEGVAHAYNNLAWVYRSLKKFAEAHESVDKAIKLLGPDDPFLPQFFDTKAQIFLDQRDFPRAVDLARLAVSLVQETNRHGVLCEHLCTLGRAYSGAEEYSLADAAFTRAADAAEHLNDPELLFKVTSARKETAQKFVRDADVKLAELAMRMNNFSTRAAAKKLGLTRQGLQKLLARNSKKWQPKLPQRSILKPLK